MSEICPEDQENFFRTSEGFDDEEEEEPISFVEGWYSLGVRSYADHISDVEMRHLNNDDLEEEA